MKIVCNILLFLGLISFAQGQTIRLDDVLSKIDCRSEQSIRGAIKMKGDDDSNWKLDNYLEDIFQAGDLNELIRIEKQIRNNFFNKSFRRNKLSILKEENFLILSKEDKNIQSKRLEIACSLVRFIIQDYIDNPEQLNERGFQNTYRFYKKISERDSLNDQPQEKPVILKPKETSTINKKPSMSKRRMTGEPVFVQDNIPHVRNQDLILQWVIIGAGVVVAILLILLIKSFFTKSSKNVESNKIDEKLLENLRGEIEGLQNKVTSLEEDKKKTEKRFKDLAKQIEGNLFVYANKSSKSVDLEKQLEEVSQQIKTQEELINDFVINFDGQFFKKQDLDKELKSNFLFDKKIEKAKEELFDKLIKQFDLYKLNIQNTWKEFQVSINNKLKQGKSNNINTLETNKLTFLQKEHAVLKKSLEESINANRLGIGNDLKIFKENLEAQEKENLSELVELKISEKATSFRKAVEKIIQKEIALSGNSGGLTKEEVTYLINQLRPKVTGQKPLDIKSLVKEELKNQKKGLNEDQVLGLIEENKPNEINYEALMKAVVKEEIEKNKVNRKEIEKIASVEFDKSFDKHFIAEEIRRIVENTIQTSKMSLVKNEADNKKIKSLIQSELNNLLEEKTQPSEIKDTSNWEKLIKEEVEKQSIGEKKIQRIIDKKLKEQPSSSWVGKLFGETTNPKREKGQKKSKKPKSVSPPPIPIKDEKPIINEDLIIPSKLSNKALYASVPTPGGYFLEKHIKSNYNKGRTFYQINVSTTNSERASYSMLERKDVLDMAFKIPDTYVIPGCDIEGENMNIEYLKIIIPGVLEKENGNWKIIKKAKIIFQDETISKVVLKEKMHKFYCHAPNSKNLFLGRFLSSELDLKNEKLVYELSILDKKPNEGHFKLLVHPEAIKYVLQVPDQRLFTAYNTEGLGDIKVAENIEVSRGIVRKTGQNWQIIQKGSLRYS